MDTTKNNINDKHLEFIQNTISRMGQNSFQAKTWNVTILSAIFTFYLVQNESVNFKLLFIISLGVTVLFCLIDVYYLYLERGYRYLYNEVISGKENIAHYSMAIPQCKRGIISFLKAFLSFSTSGFYGSIFIGLIIINNII